MDGWTEPVTFKYLRCERFDHRKGKQSTLRQRAILSRSKKRKELVCTHLRVHTRHSALTVLRCFMAPVHYQDREDSSLKTCYTRWASWLLCREPVWPSGKALGR